MALKALFGLDVSSETTELNIAGVQVDKLEVLSRVVSIIEHIPEVEGSGISSCDLKSSVQEVIFRMLGKFNPLRTRGSPNFQNCVNVLLKYLMKTFKQKL